MTIEYRNKVDQVVKTQTVDPRQREFRYVHDGYNYEPAEQRGDVFVYRQKDRA